MQIINRISFKKEVLPNWLTKNNNIILGSIDDIDWDILKKALKIFQKKIKLS